MPALWSKSSVGTGRRYKLLIIVCATLCLPEKFRIIWRMVLQDSAARDAETYQPCLFEMAGCKQLIPSYGEAADAKSDRSRHLHRDPCYKLLIMFRSPFFVDRRGMDGNNSFQELRVGLPYNPSQGTIYWRFPGSADTGLMAMATGLKAGIHGNTGRSREGSQGITLLCTRHDRHRPIPRRQADADSPRRTSFCRPTMYGRMAVPDPGVTLSLPAVNAGNIVSLCGITAGGVDRPFPFSPLMRCELPELNARGRIEGDCSTT